MNWPMGSVHEAAWRNFKILTVDFRISQHYSLYYLPTSTELTMSRSLDPETAASVKTNDLHAVYQDIVAALSIEAQGLLQIELLGKSHPMPPGSNVLIDGNNIGVPKLKLVQAFIVARETLFKHFRNCPKDKETELQNATAVILLMDPEHLTAANSRKRLIQKYHKIPKLEFEKILKAESLFVDSYLTSPLHRHTKSPTLWGHRRWLYEMGKSIGIEFDVLQDLKYVVLIAAERHPKNYYAWSHLRWLTQDFGRAEVSDHPKMLAIVKDWCLRHPADTSGFSFLLFILFAPGSSDNSPGKIEACSSVCREVLRLTVSFKWIHESVWVFLRTLVASEYVVEDDRKAFFEAIETLQKAYPMAQVLLETAGDWFVKYQRTA
jgi:protein prenyltransferase alpha subunit repeat containing protein 1